MPKSTTAIAERGAPFLESPREGRGDCSGLQKCIRKIGEAVSWFFSKIWWLLRCCPREEPSLPAQRVQVPPSPAALPREAVPTPHVSSPRIESCCAQKIWLGNCKIPYLNEWSGKGKIFAMEAIYRIIQAYNAEEAWASNDFVNEILKAGFEICRNGGKTDILLVNAFKDKVRCQNELVSPHPVTLKRDAGGDPMSSTYKAHLQSAFQALTQTASKEGLSAALITKGLEHFGVVFIKNKRQVNVYLFDPHGDRGGNASIKLFSTVEKFQSYFAQQRAPFSLSAPDDLGIQEFSLITPPLSAEEIKEGLGLFVTLEETHRVLDRLAYSQKIEGSIEHSVALIRQAWSEIDAGPDISLEKALHLYKDKLCSFLLHDKEFNPFSTFLDPLLTDTERGPYGIGALILRKVGTEQVFGLILHIDAYQEKDETTFYLVDQSGLARGTKKCFTSKEELLGYMHTGEGGTEKDQYIAYQVELQEDN
ncbi:MAG: hypothetical protein KGJ02_06300 [Verrucomicrobiota bacterium]|nr:hypothetical protein [Verrucomicrobiota bacterium]